MNKKEASEFEKFDQAVRHILTVSHEELQKREKVWKKKRKRTVTARQAAKKETKSV